MSDLSGEQPIVIESRLHLFSALSEAAETEHNLMCLYIYATLSLKRCTEEGVSVEELKLIEGWRRVIMGISLEEMTHLCLVSNLFSALGGTAHFMRPNFPVSPGLYPSDFVLELAPFDLDAIEHFIFLERPASYDMTDAEAFKPQMRYERTPPRNRVMPSSGDYKTVGQLYDAIREALVRLSHDLGEKVLFCGDPKRQVTLVDVPLPGLIAIHDLESALKAINTIITQGEGATSEVDSHFERFSKIKSEYLNQLKVNPAFKPGRAVVRNPVMRKPINPENRVWITHPVGAQFMDLANAIYMFTLRALTQVYSVEDRSAEEKHELLSMSLSMMHVMAALGETLTLIPVSEQAQDQYSGMSFAMVRTLQPLAKKNELDLMSEAVQRFDMNLKGLRLNLDSMGIPSKAIKICSVQLSKVQAEIGDLQLKLNALREARKLQNAAPKIETTKIAAKEAIPKSIEQGDIKIIKGKRINVRYDGKKCIHTRHCVTELPQVFKANLPGDWIVPDDASAEMLAAVIHECPSGALTYESNGDFPNEPTPATNVMRVYENGPYAFIADLEIDGKKAGYRATLCRCGLSKNKPYCDHSHAAAKFVATGEPATIDDQPLSARGGTLKINRTKDGPLSISGNLEICAATGRVVLRTEAVNLCRCGHSKSKPVCDSSHVKVSFKDPVDLPAKDPAGSSLKDPLDPSLATPKPQF